MNPNATYDTVTPTRNGESGRLAWTDRAARRLMLARLQNLRGGRLTLADPAGICELGSVSEGDLRAVLPELLRGGFRRAVHQSGASAVRQAALPP
jgi:hypothetical protein